MPGKDVALKDFGGGVVKVEHTAIERQNVFRCGFRGSGGDATGDRLHVSGQVVGFRRCRRARERQGGRRHKGAVFQKQIAVHAFLHEACTHLDAQG